MRPDEKIQTFTTMLYIKILNYCYTSETHPSFMIKIISYLPTRYFWWESV